MNGKADKGLVVDLAQSPEPKRRRRSVDRNMLSHSEVCAILETCLRCGVSQFSYNGLVLSFLKGSPVSHEAVLAGCPTSPVTAEEVAQGRADGLTALANGVDDELEMLKITDPFAYEKFIAGEARS